jgi:hypothetical protein
MPLLGRAPIVGGILGRMAGSEAASTPGLLGSGILGRFGIGPNFAPAAEEAAMNPFGVPLGPNGYTPGYAASMAGATPYTPPPGPMALPPGSWPGAQLPMPPIGGYQGLLAGLNPAYAAEGLPFGYGFGR